MTDKTPKKRKKITPKTPNKKVSNKKLPARRTKEMSVKTAKRIWFAPKGKGRPSKDRRLKLEEAKKILLAAKEPLKRQVVRKNKRGRPRTHPKIVDKPKRPRGRPRKHPKAVDKPKRPRGRPRKHPKDVKSKIPKKNKKDEEDPKKR